MSKSDRRVCKERDCELEAAPRRQWCEECWLNRQPPIVRVQAAEARLALIPEEFRIPKVPDKRWPPGRRWCAGCQTFMRLSDCAGARCKACQSVARHRSSIKAKFGLSPTTWQWLFDKQLGRCAICRQRPRSKRLAVDHDHTCQFCGGGSTGCERCVRGLICASPCNDILLDAARHNPDILERAANYLRVPPMSDDWTPPTVELEAWRAQYGTDDPAPF